MAVGGEKLDRSISRGIAADHHSRTKAHNSDKSIVLSVNHIAGPEQRSSRKDTTKTICLLHSSVASSVYRCTSYRVSMLFLMGSHATVVNRAIVPAFPQATCIAPKTQHSSALFFKDGSRPSSMPFARSLCFTKHG